MSKHRNPLSPERWAYLKALVPSAPRILHNSIAPDGSSRNERRVMFKEAKKRASAEGRNPDEVATPPSEGRTFCAFRNDRKAMRRAAMAEAKAYRPN